MWTAFGLGEDQERGVVTFRSRVSKQFLNVDEFFKTTVMVAYTRGIMLCQ